LKASAPSDAVSPGEEDGAEIDSDLCHPKGVPSDGASAERHAFPAPCLPLPLPGAAPLRSQLAQGRGPWTSCPTPAGLRASSSPLPRLPTSARHSASDVASSCAPRSPSSEPSPHSSRRNRSKLSDLASRTKASAERSSYPLPRSLPPDLLPAQALASTQARIQCEKRKAQQAQRRLALIPEARPRMVLGLRTLGKGLRAGAGVAAGTAKAVAWVAVGTVANVGRVVLAAKAAVTGEHREESPAGEEELVSAGDPSPAPTDSEPEMTQPKEGTENSHARSQQVQRSLLRHPSSCALDVAEGVCEGEPEPPSKLATQSTTSEVSTQLANGVPGEKECSEHQGHGLCPNCNCVQFTGTAELLLQWFQEDTGRSSLPERWVLSILKYAAMQLQTLHWGTAGGCTLPAWAWRTSISTTFP